MRPQKDPFYSSEILLSEKAVKRNVDFVRKCINDKVIISAVVKGNAYGHGIDQMVPLLEKAGVNHLSVFSAHEAFRVCAVKADSTTVMILGWIDNEQIEWAIQHDVQFYVFEMDRLKAAIQIASKVGKKAKIHIEVETGMNRTGFERKELKSVIQYLLDHKEHYEFEGLCTHYAGAESITNYLRIKEQINLYHEIASKFEDSGLVPKLKHTACSAALISYPETHMDMVRVGIILYGFWPSRETFIFHQKQNAVYKDPKEAAKVMYPLQRVITWRSKIMSIKNVPMGEFIGYGTSYQAPKNMKIATVPVGYAYGFTRALSNQGRVIVRGKRVAVIGTVNMNLMLINVSEIKDIEKGDEVIIIGRKGKQKVTVASFGEMSNMLNYELLSRLPMDIPRNRIE